MTYVLGMRQKSGKKADQGTIVHKVMEILANCKQSMQENPIENWYTFEDEHIGTVSWTQAEFLTPTLLTNGEIDTINKTRINKYKYKHDATLTYGTYRHGVNMVNYIIDRVYDYYKWDDWEAIDKKDCVNWSWMALEYKEGAFDPRRSNIKAAEPKFDFIIDKEWAKFDWNLPGGENISGHLGIKGTIDLILEIKEGIILEVLDFKTGQRIDWASKSKDNIKTYERICNDFQLLLYYYAVRKMYPGYKQVIVSIFYIRDGGVFTVCLDDNTMIEVERRLKERFETIARCELPAMQDVTQRDFRCTRLCDFYKNVAPNGENMCKFIHDKIQQKGIDYVTNKYTMDGFSIGQYQEPGEKGK